jgi:FtsP/CotA-like multicopper oxidase with cupredoxin domain
MSNDLSVDGLMYNDQVPGPVLRATVGDTVVVHFKNELTESTTIHWHGVRLHPEMDGVDGVVAPGATFTYRFTVPDAGTFWYHPHTNETVQIERGLYGALIVAEKDAPALDGEQVLVFDDAAVTDGAFSKPGWYLPRIMERHNGREGNVALINGRSDIVLRLSAGQRERWRLVNAGNARYLRLSFGGRSFTQIASDGGLLEEPVILSEIMIAPGERADIVVGPFPEGDQFQISSLPYNRGTGRGREIVYGRVQVGEMKPSIAQLPKKLREIEPLASADAEPNRIIKLHGKSNWKNGVDFTINDEQHLQDAPVRSGDLQVWEIRNPSMMDHPFHLHGYFFQVLSVNGIPVERRAWKDTVNVKKGDTVKIAWMPDDRTGGWMYHCHILEHHDAGMMAHFAVENDSHPAIHVLDHCLVA